MAIENSAPITIPYNFKPRGYQLDLFRGMDGIEGKPATRKRRAILRWHRRAGKDKACFCFLIKEAAQVPGNYFYIFPTKTMARQALWENIDSDGFKLLDHIPPQFIARKSNQEMLVELTNGSTIRVLGYDKDPDSIRGIACKGVVFSEFAFSDPQSYKTLMPSLRESRGWAIFNSTPNGHNHFFDMWQAAANSDRWFASELQTYWPTRENYSGLVKPDEFEMIVKEEGLSWEDVEREYGVSFNAAAVGSFYMESIEKALTNGRIGDYIHDDSKCVDTFWDLGLKDSTAVWFRQRSGNKLIFINYYENSGKDLQHYVSMLFEKGYHFGIHYLPHDGSQRNMAIANAPQTSEVFEDLLRDYNVSGDVEIVPKISRRQIGINLVRSRFSRYCFDKENCEDGLDKLEKYHRKWDHKRKVFSLEAEHDYCSHAADAIRMEAQAGDVDSFPGQKKVIVVNEFDLWDY